MTDGPALRPASPEELREALAYALRFDGRKRHHHADGFMAQIAAEKLMEHLERSALTYEGVEIPSVISPLKT